MTIDQFMNIYTPPKSRIYQLRGDIAEVKNENEHTREIAEQCCEKLYYSVSLYAQCSIRIDSKITFSELEQPLSQMKKVRAPAKYKLTNEMITLGGATTQKIMTNFLSAFRSSQIVRKLDD